MSDVREAPQVDPGHYRFTEYVHAGRWASYWHQIAEVLQFQPSSVLEVGVGLGVFSAIARIEGTKVTTLDLDGRLAPTCVGSVRHLPFSDRSFDVTACCQVLEHLPYECFVPSVKELLRVSRHGVVLSVPDRSRAVRLAAYLPRLGAFKWLLPLPTLRPPLFGPDGQHRWEVGTVGYPLARVVTDISALNVANLRTFRVFEWPYHRFFVLRLGSDD